MYIVETWIKITIGKSSTVVHLVTAHLTYGGAESNWHSDIANPRTLTSVIWDVGALTQVRAIINEPVANSGVKPVDDSGKVL